MKKTPVGIGAAALVVGLGAAVGIGASLPDPTQSTAYTGLASKYHTAESARNDTEADITEFRTQLTSMTGERDDLQAQIGDLPEREDAVKQAQVRVKTRERKVTAREKAVAKGERRVGLVEAEIRKNTIHDGTYQVGVDIKAGTYETKGASGCYWSVNGDPNGEHILANNIGDGPAVVSVSTGQYLELSCSDAAWVLQR